MTADDDFKLLHFGIGFTNMVARPTKGSADLTRKEIREGGRILLEKLQQYRPKIAVFNGKGIYEVFSGKKDFAFGKQPECIDGTNTVSSQSFPFGLSFRSIIPFTCFRCPLFRACQLLKGAYKEKVCPLSGCLVQCPTVPIMSK